MLKALLGALALAVAPVMANVGSAYPGKPSDCNLAEVTVPSGCTLTTKPPNTLSAWCEVTEAAPTGPTGGTPSALLGASQSCEVCPPNCGQPDKPQPAGKSCALTLTVTFTDTAKHAVTASISGGTFIAGIQAKLDGMFGGDFSKATTATSTVTVTVGPCAWQTEALKMTVNYGETITESVTVQPRKTWTCGSGSTIFEGSGATVSGTITETADVALQNSAKAVTVANGTCPPNPPN